MRPSAQGDVALLEAGTDRAGALRLMARRPLYQNAAPVGTLAAP
jgi:hypothetical protein